MRRSAIAELAKAQIEATTADGATSRVGARKAVIFATGGFGKIYKTTSNAHTLTGDGMGIIFRKGKIVKNVLKSQQAKASQ